MTLFIALSLMFLFVFYFVTKDRRYLKKSTRDVVSEDVKKLLNIPTKSDEFPNKVLQKMPKTSASTRLLAELNKEDES